MNNCLLTAPTVPLLTVTTISTDQLVGTEVNLTCTVQEAFPGLTSMPSVSWQTLTTRDVFITSEFQNESTAISLLRFSSLRSQQVMQYTCRGTLTYLGSQLETVESAVTMRLNCELDHVASISSCQIWCCRLWSIWLIYPWNLVHLDFAVPAPTVSINVLSTGKPPYNLGAEITLTCTASHIDQVDSLNIVATFFWYSSGSLLESGDGRVSITSNRSTPLVSVLRILSLRPSDRNITCSSEIYLESLRNRPSPLGSGISILMLEG